MTIEKGVGFPITAIDQFSGAFDKLTAKIVSVEGGIGRLSGMLNMLTGGAMATFVVSMIRASEDAVESQRRLEGVLRATGNQTGYTASALDKLADAMARTSKFDDESFRNATATLVRFGNIGGQNLQRVLKLTADYAALTGGDLAAAAETMGRALNNPADGLARLERGFGDLGIQTREAIKLQEEMGNRAGALELALGALEKKIGGSDAHMNQGLTGAFRGLTKAISELLETGGGAIDNAATVGVLDAISARLRGLKAVMEGPWSFKLLAILGGSDVLAKLGNLKPEAIAPTGGGVFGGIDLSDQDKRGEAYLAKVVNDRKRAADEIAAHNERMRMLDAAGWVRYIEVMKQTDEDALREQAKRTQEYYDNKDWLRTMDLEGQEALARNVVRVVDAETRQTEALRQASVMGFWNDISDAAGNFFSDLVMNGRSAFDNLRRWVKQLLADMVALFAKRWVLSIAAGGTMLGSAGSAMAGGLGVVGDGTAAGGLLSSFGSILPGGEIATAVGNFASMGASMFGAGGSLATTIGSVASFLPAIGTAVAVAAMIYSAFNDGPENPNFRWMQGIGGQGAFGGISSEGNFNFDSSGLTRYVGGLDARFARILGAEGSATVTTALAGYTQAGLRMDGQPAQFAFPEGTDREAAEQLAKELLQSRYGTIFAQIDEGIASQIRAFSGTSTELQTFIETALGVVEGLAGMNVTGLNITTLQLMAQEGETLGQTFQRVGGQWAQFNQLFTTEAERLTAAQDLVTSTFADLGVAIPATKDGFEELVRGLDLSTEAGRDFFEALMEVAPAFSAVEDAAASMMQSFYSLMGELRGPAYTTSITQGLLQGAVQEFMGQNSWTSGMSWQDVAGAFSTITAEDFAAYSTSSQQLILQILGYQNQLNQAAGETESYTDAVVGAAGAVTGLADAIANAKNGIADWLDKIFLSDLSPLTPQERLDSAQNAYVENLLKAQAGDVGAIGAFTQFADAYLKEVQSFWASSPAYRAIFESVTDQAKGLAGLEDARPIARLDAKEDTDRIVRELRAIAITIRDGQTALARKTEDVGKAVDRMNRSQKEAISTQTRDLRTDLGV
ncbi:MAG: hypothetical protein FIB00_13515 [Chloroflexi bacterium]|nr:hypothetical protein [Chloroflexota bacterium]